MHKSPCRHCGPPTSIAKDHTVVSAVGSEDLSQRDTMLPRLWCRYTPHLVPCTPRPGVTACSSRPSPTSERLPSPHQSLKSGRRECFLKCANTLQMQRYRDHKEPGKTDSTKGVSEPPVPGPKEIEIQVLTDK